MKNINLSIVHTSDYEVFSYIGGHYGICLINSHGVDCVYGGDSACEDHYDLEFMTEVLNNWDGKLIGGIIEL